MRRISRKTLRWLLPGAALGLATGTALAMGMTLATGTARAAVVERTVEVPMRDGVRLEAALYLPRDAAPAPTILIRTPYARQQHVEEGRYWAENGYAVLVQDVRGKFGSGGLYVPFLNEHADGVDTLDWIARQPWSDGSVGMWGSSYLAFCQLVLAATGHPALQSILPISGWIRDDGVIRHGGAYHVLLSIPWILHEESQTQRPIGDVDLELLFEHLPLIDAFDSIGLESKIWNEEFDFSPLDAFAAEEIAIPALHVTGWNDFVYEGSLGVYRQTLGGPAADAQRLVVGPWFHDQIYTTYTEAGDEDFGPASAMGRERLRELSLAWFDATLGDGAGNLDAWPRARVFVMGANEWRELESWPPPETEVRPLFLGATRGANGSGGDGTLSPQPPAEPGHDAYIFDPMRPVPTYGGANFHFLMHLVGIKDQRDIEARQDVLVYTTPPLDEELAIAGPLRVVLYAATDAPDTDFTAKLVEVRSDGYARIVEEGIVRASYRDGPRARSLIEPGRIYELAIDLGSTALRIPAGHRVRLEISSSNFPKYDRNPNTGEEPLEARVLKTAVQRIYHGAEFPSRLELPVLAERASGPTEGEIHDQP